MAKQSVIKRKKNPGILVPLVLALAVTFLFYKGAQQQALAQVQPVQVPVAKERLAEHTQIKETDIAMVTIPGKGVPPNILRDPKDIVGKYVGTKYTIPKNGYFYKDAVSNLEDIPSRVSMMLGPNQLGITMRIDLEKSVANSLREGQYVQVRFFTNKTPSKQPFEGVLYDRLKILALRDSSGTDVTNNDDKKTRVPTIVVFEANDEQVSYLLRAQALGELNIVAISDKQADNDSSANPTMDKNSQPSDQAIKDVLDAASKSLTPDQLAVLQKALLNNTDAGRGHVYTKNAAQLLIDSMSYTIEQLFSENGILSTPDGEIVYYDRDTNQIRYFKDKSEYEGSIYALSQLTDEQIAKLEKDGKLTEAQKQALAQRRQAAQEPQYYETTKGEIFEIINGKAVFHSDDEVIQTLTDLKKKNGRLSADNQALLDKLLNKKSSAGAGTGSGTGSSNQNSANSNPAQKKQ